MCRVQRFYECVGVWGGEGPKTKPMVGGKGIVNLSRGSDEDTYGSNTSQEASECHRLLEGARTMAEET